MSQSEMVTPSPQRTDEELHVSLHALLQTKTTHPVDQTIQTALDQMT